MIKTMRYHYIAIFVVCSVIISCNESLPTRDDVSNLFESKISSYFSRVNGIHYFNILFMVKNTSDETIEENAVFNGSLEVTWVPSRPEESPTGVNKKRSFVISKNNIFTARGYNASTGKLLMEPNDSIVFYVQWNLKTNDSTFLPGYWSSIQDNQCRVFNSNGIIQNRIISKRQQFAVSASIKLFDNFAVLYSAPTTIEQCYVAPYLQEANPANTPCTNINIVDPCSIISQ